MSVEKGLKKSNALWRDTNFIVLWCGTILSALGSSLYFILIAWFAVDRLGPDALAKALLFLSLPRLFFMLTGGVLADRINRKSILIGSVLARAIIMASFALFTWIGDQNFITEVAYLTSALFGIVDAFFWPARNSIMPFIVEEEHLSAANSLFETALQLSMVMGPLLASALLPLASYPVMFLSVALLYFASVAFIRFVKTTEYPPTNEHGSENAPLREIYQGFVYARTIPSLLVILIVTFLISLFIQGPINIGLPLLVKLKGWSGSSYGLIEGFWGIGAITGGLINLAAGGFRGRFKLIPLFIALMGLSFTGLGFLPNLPAGVTAMFITGMFWTMANIPLTTFLQTTTEPEFLGRVMGLQTLTSFGLGPLSYALTPLLLNHSLLSPQGLIKGSGIFLLLTGLITLLSGQFNKMETNPLWNKKTE